MNIILVTIAYPPEIRSISTMTKELAEELVKRGHQVTVLTSWPKYNLSGEAEGKRFNADSMENGVRVIRIKTLPHHKVHYLLRGVAQITLPFFFMRSFKKLVKDKVDAVVVYSPHLPLAQVGARIKRMYGVRYLLNIQDIFPQNAVDLGILKNRLIIKFFERMERKAYSEADAITTHTVGGRQFLIERKGVPSHKIKVVENWIDVGPYLRMRASGIFRARYGLAGKFIFLFPGVFGPAQNLDFIVAIAKRVSGIHEMCFLFVGDGTDKIRLQEQVRAHGLRNVIFQPFVSSEEYPLLVKEVNVGLLSLGGDNKTAAVPGKLLSYMAASLPVVAFLNKESEGHRIINDAQCGYAIIPDDVERAAHLICDVFKNRGQLDELGRNGYDYVTKHFSKQACINALERLICV